MALRHESRHLSIVVFGYIFGSAVGYVCLFLLPPQRFPDPTDPVSRRSRDIQPALQLKLLRVLQEQEFERLGSCRTHRVNMRLVTATHRDLKEMVRRNEFRRELYSPVVLPPLRERRGDIPQLVRHFVETFPENGQAITQISKETLDELVAYSWPGNIRELQNLIERAAILADNGLLPNPLPVSPKKVVVMAPA